MSSAAILIADIDKRSCMTNHSTAILSSGAVLRLYGRANGIHKYHRVFLRQSLRQSRMHGGTSSGSGN